MATLEENKTVLLNTLGKSAEIVTASRKKEYHCKTRMDLTRVLPVYLLNDLASFKDITLIKNGGTYYHSNTRGSKWEMMVDEDIKVLLTYCDITSKETK